MAYGQQNNSNSNRAPANRPTAAATGTTTKALSPGVVLSTGLFAPDREGSKAIATVRVKETVTIEAGSYINLYENNKKTSDKSPLFNIQVRKATKKAQ